MIDFNSVLQNARALSPQDQARLIDALWPALSADADIPLHAEWAPELERRVEELKSGTQRTVSWSEIRTAALARIGHGTQS